MRNELWAFSLLAIAGLLQAVFAVPMKHTRGWRWEQVWTAQSVTANVLFPLVWAMAAPSAFWAAAARIPASHWVTSYGWGLLWGIGGIAYSLTLTRLGMAFANSFIMGVAIITGTLLPLVLNVVHAPKRPASFITGLLLCITMTALLGLFRRQGVQEPLLVMPFCLASYGKVVAVAMVAGFLSASYGLAFSFKFETVQTLSSADLSPLSASLLVLLPVYLGAASVAIPMGVAYARKSGTASLFLRGHAPRNWLNALVMGLCAAGTAISYNFGSTMDGHPSPNVSFATFITFLVLGGVLLGFFAGEMRGASRSARVGLLVSACGLVAGAAFLNAR